MAGGRVRLATPGRTRTLSALAIYAPCAPSISSCSINLIHGHFTRWLASRAMKRIRLKKTQESRDSDSTPGGERRLCRAPHSLDRVPWSGVAGVVWSPRSPAEAGLVRWPRRATRRRDHCSAERSFPGSFSGHAGRPTRRSARAGSHREADDGSFVGEDVDDLGSPLDLAIEPLDRIGGVQLGAMRRRGAHTLRRHNKF